MTVANSLKLLPRTTALQINEENWFLCNMLRTSIVGSAVKGISQSIDLALAVPVSMCNLYIYISKYIKLHISYINLMSWDYSLFLLVVQLSLRQLPNRQNKNVFSNLCKLANIPQAVKLT